ncbi:MAG TPA: glycosyltransferase family 2 protein [Thermomicrobiales bacterium]|nr:glycosyltransferase family 2 protein [Thermomicrobiales bacterium]
MGAPMEGRELVVSIITPSLNQGRFIEQALASMRAQTCGCVEHIVVDGGSTDETLEILGRAQTAGDLRFISEADGGMYDALNKGLRMANGEILGYLNCDDAYTPWAIETAVRVLEANPDADAVFGDGLTIDESTGRQRLSLLPPFDRDALALSGSLVQPAVFWRRSAYERIGGFDAGLRYVGDLDYWLRLGATARFVRVDEVLAIERHHDAALSRAASNQMTIEEAEMRARHRSVTRTSRLFARARAAAWRRYQWLRFLMRVRDAAPGAGPWSEFTRNGDLQVAPGRVVAMFIPRVGGPYAWDAVRSRRDWFGAG